MGKSKLVAGTAGGYGKDVPEARRKTDVTILDIVDDAAVAKVDAGPWIDYLQLVNDPDLGWVILNVLWEKVEPTP